MYFIAFADLLAEHRNLSVDGYPALGYSGIGRPPAETGSAGDKLINPHPHSLS
jgi:hypothetical protein